MKLPKGAHVKPEKVENFYKICKELSSDFNGAMRMQGEIDREIYFADLLIQDGSIIATSFKQQSDDLTTKKEKAIDDIQEKFAGSSGKLDLFSFTPDEMKRAIESNTEYLLEDELKVYDLIIKIKSKKVKEKKPRFTFLKKIFAKLSSSKKEDRIRELREETPTGAVKPGRESAVRVRERQGPEAEGKLREKPERPRPEAERKLESVEELKNQKRVKLVEAKTGIPGVGVSKKEARLREIKEKRLERLSKLDKKVEKPKKTAVESTKIETNIDKLLNMVKGGETIKINDGLANRLNVSKTQVEEWAMILEEHNLVELHYPTIGEPEIRRLKEE